MNTADDSSSSNSTPVSVVASQIAELKRCQAAYRQQKDQLPRDHWVIYVNGERRVTGKSQQAVLAQAPIDAPYLCIQVGHDDSGDVDSGPSLCLAAADVDYSGHAFSDVVIRHVSAIGTPLGDPSKLRMLIDTGASHCMLSDEEWTKRKFIPTGITTGSSFGVALDKIVARADLTVDERIHSKMFVATVEKSVHSVVGMNLLRHCNMEWMDGKVDVKDRANCPCAPIDK